MEHAEAVLDRTALLSRWQALSANPDTPDYYELNEYGELIMAPKPNNDHQRVIQEVALQLIACVGRLAVPEVSIMTDRGIRVPNVGWMPAEKWDQFKGRTPLPIAPDLCVEVLSPGNTREEIAMKTGAYLRAGAREVLVVGLKGEVEFYGTEGKRATSALGVTLDLPASLF
jgi:Uma2 family endonuclease